MSIDINKIIQESVQETLNSQEEDEQTLEETTKEENIEESADNKEETTQENTEDENSFDPAAASAISAGLGALTFRNHYRALKEQAQNDDKKKGKKGKLAAGLGAAGVAGGAGYLGRGAIEAGTGNRADWNVSNIGKNLKKGYDKVTGDD